MVGFLVISGICALIFVAPTLLLGWSIKRYGIAEPPEEVKCLDSRIKNGAVHVDLIPFTFDKEKYGRKTYRRLFVTEDGKWELTIELEGDEVIAYQAVFKHKTSWWRETVRENWKKYPKIMMPSG